MKMENKIDIHIHIHTRMRKKPTSMYVCVMQTFAQDHRTITSNVSTSTATQTKGNYYNTKFLFPTLRPFPLTAAPFACFWISFCACICCAHKMRGQNCKKMSVTTIHCWRYSGKCVFCFTFWKKKKTHQENPKENT